MIAIVNIGPHDDPDPTGWRNCEVRINHEVIATFTHKREHGLGAMLAHGRCCRGGCAGSVARSIARAG